MEGSSRPTVIIAEDRDIVDSGLAYEHWRDFYSVMRALHSSHVNLQAASTLTAVGVQGVSSAVSAMGRLSRSRAGFVLTATTTLALAAVAYRRRADIQAVWRQSGDRRHDALQTWTESIAAFTERVDAAEQFWLAAERGRSPATLLHRVALKLSTTAPPQSRTELVSALEPTRSRANMARVASVLEQHPAFVQATRYRWQLGREGTNFGGIMPVDS